MDVLGFIYVSLGSSTVQLHDSLSCRRACVCSEARFRKWRPCLRSVLPKSCVRIPGAENANLYMMEWNFVYVMWVLCLPLSDIPRVRSRARISNSGSISRHEVTYETWPQRVHICGYIRRHFQQLCSCSRVSLWYSCFLQLRNLWSKVSSGLQFSASLYFRGC
jgi:hypothetical protein